MYYKNVDRFATEKIATHNPSTILTMSFNWRIKMFIDFSGKRFGKLLVLNKKEKRGHYNFWLCKCDCGKSVWIRSNSLNNGHAKSCGCNKKRTLYEKPTKEINLYKIWSGMKARCFNKNCLNYPHYGLRGIKVCDEWSKDFMSFYNWAVENGYKKGLSIDRIDVNGNYEPANCRWATAKEQSNNQTKTIRINYKGEEKTISDLCYVFGIKYSTLYGRIKRGIPIECALKI